MKAQRNFAVGYVSGYLYFLASEFGLDAAAEMAERALRITLYQRLPFLRQALELPGDADGLSTAALLLARAQQCLGEQTESEVQADGAIVIRQLTSRIHRGREFVEDARGTLFPVLEDAIVRAWADVFRSIDRQIEVTTPASFARGDDEWRWVISRGASPTSA